MRTLATSSLVVVFLVFGCTGEEGETPSDGGSESPTEAQAKKEVGEAVAAVKALAGEKAKQFQKTMQANLASMDKRIDELKKKAQQAAADGKEELEEQMQTLAEKRQAFQEKLDELGSSTGEAWEDVKVGLQDAYQDLEKAVQQAAAHFDEAEAETSGGGGGEAQG